MKHIKLDDILNREESQGNSNEQIIELNKIISEYLKAYIILGYDSNGESLCIINGTTEQDFVSLEPLVNRYASISLIPDRDNTDFNENEDEH